MLETPHVAFGAAIAIKTGNPWVAIPLAFTSHFLLERVPHWNPHLNTEMKKYGKLTDTTKLVIGIDLVSAICLSAFLAQTQSPNNLQMFNVLASSFASILPDLMEGPYFFLGMRGKFLTWWLKSQKALQVDASPFWGLLTQAVTIFFSIYWIFN